MIKAPVQLQESDVAEPARLVRALNDILLDAQQRLGVLEELPRLFVVEPFVIQTNAVSTAYGQAPFPIRVALPQEVTPAGVVLVGLENLERGTIPGTVAFDVKWAVTPGGGGVLIRHIPALALDSKYLVRLVVIRG